jgi:phosphate transport system protein
MLKPYKESLTEVTSLVHDYIVALKEALVTGDTPDNLYKMNIHKIDEKVVEILALYQPQGEYLRDVIAYLKLSSFIQKMKKDIESYNKNKDFLEENSNITALYNNALSAITDLVDMLETCDDLDIEYASIISKEKIADDLYKELYINMKNSEDTEKALKTLNTAKKLEKLTDNVKTVAHYIIFACQGVEI